MDANPGGRFKGKDPTVPQTLLPSQWVTGATVIYIGKATNLRKRLGQYRDFGQGKPIGHWGGRYVWQPQGAAHHIVCWKKDDVSRNIERQMLAQFRTRFGALPFANINS